MRPRLVLLLLLTSPCVSGLAAASVAPRPNILFVLADDWSFPHAGIYGCTWVNTPNFDRVAREGVLFTHAYTPVAKCSASRASILTGRNPWVNEAGFTHWNFFPAAFAAFPEVLAQHGYATGFTGKGWAPGEALTADGRKRALTGRAYQQIKRSPATTGINATDYAANFAAFLDDVPVDQPWFFWFGSNQPHRDYEYQSGVRIGHKSLADLPAVPAYWPDNEAVRHDLLDYALEVEDFDHTLGQALAELARRGELEHTLIVVTSDNGMPFPRAKGQCYEIANHMPLAIRWPAAVARPGIRRDDFVSFVDYAPTLLDAAGIDYASSGMSAPSGRSLRPLLAASAAGALDPTRDHVLIGRERHDPGRPLNAGYPVRGIVEGNLLYLHNFAPDRWPAGNPETGYLDVDRSPTKDALLAARRAKGSDAQWALSFGRRGADELYDLTRDPDNLVNLAASPVHAADVLRLRTRLLTELEAQGDKRLVSGNPDYFDQFTFSHDAFNDLYERWQAGTTPLPHWADPDTLSTEPQPE